MPAGQFLAALMGPWSCFVQRQHFDLLKSTWPNWLWIEVAVRGHMLRSHGSKPGVNAEPCLLISHGRNCP